MFPENVPKYDTMSSTVIEKICDFLKCQPGDIMENVTKEDIQKAGKIINEKIAEVMDVLEATTGMSKKAILDNFAKEMPAYIEKLKKGEIDVLGIENMNDKNKN